MPSEIGSRVLLRINSSADECCSKCRIGERTLGAVSTCSNLNLSDHMINGRQTSWSVATMMPITAHRPQMIARVSPVAEAVDRYDTRPGKRKSRLQRTNISQTMRKNQPPATDTIEFQIKPMAEYGSSSCQKRCHALSR